MRTVFCQHKYSAAPPIFDSLLGVWNVVKHGLSSLIYYMNLGKLQRYQALC